MSSFAPIIADNGFFCWEASTMFVNQSSSKAKSVQNSHLPIGNCLFSSLLHISLFSLLLTMFSLCIENALALSLQALPAHCVTLSTELSPYDKANKQLLALHFPLMLEWLRTRCAPNPCNWRINKTHELYPAVCA